MYRRLAIPAFLLASVLASPAGATIQRNVIVDCPLAGSGDNIDRGFYYENWPGGALEAVEVVYYASDPGNYEMGLTVRLGAYNEEILDVDGASFNSSDGTTLFVFDTGTIPPGSTLAFTHTLFDAPEPDSTVSYDSGPCGLGNQPCALCPNLFETTDTSPPLSSVRRGGVGVVISAPEPTWGMAASAALGALISLARSRPAGRSAAKRA
jgi:hypothetical protein